MTISSKKQIKFTITFCIVAMVIIIYYFALPRELFDNSYSKIVESSDGRLLSAKIAADEQWRFPLCDSVPYKFKMSLITFEDKRFYKHIGVDPLAVARAVRNNLRNKSITSGASTITMQTIRISRNRERTYKEKIIEAILATRLELRCTKDEILSLYVSHAPFGGNVVGLEAASWRYFGRSAKDLSWAESAMLAVLPNSPSLIHLGRNRTRLLEKRNKLLDKLEAQGFITAVDCELSKEEELPQAPYPIPMLAPFLLEGAKTTTINYELQKRVLEVAKHNNNIYRSNKVENLAAMVVDVKRGEVVAYVGNMYDVNDNSRGSNVDVIKAPRSSGSVLKPLLYSAMIDDASLLPTMLIADIPTYFKNFVPHNFNNSYDGAVAANRVLERSLNIPSVLMLKKYGRENFLHLLKKLGFSTINKSADHYGLSLILGGAEITAWDLANTYTALSAKLGRQPIRNISLYENKNKIIENDEIPLSKASLWLMFNSLSNVNRPEEEGQWQYYESSRKVAWKTGTSYGNRDAWAIGITPEYVVCVWVGNSSGEGRPLLTGVGYAGPVMFDIFGLLPSTSWFYAPEIELEAVEICAKSGYLATSLCEERTTLQLPSVSLNAEHCPYHKTIYLSKDQKYRVSSDNYKVSDMVQRSWFVLPPVMEWYYRRKNSDYKPLPPSIDGTKEDNPIDIIYPQQNRIVIVGKGIDGREQNVVFTAVHSDPYAKIHWHLDDTYLGTTEGEHKISNRPSKGKHQLTLIDEKGAKKSVLFSLY